MKSFLQSDWGPLLRQAARFLGHALALVWTLAVMSRDALMLMNDELATWWVAALGVAPAPNSWGLKPDALAEREHSNLRAVAAPVAPPATPSKPPRPVMPGPEMLSRWFISDQTTMGGYRLKGHAQADFWRWVATWATALRMMSSWSITVTWPMSYFAC